MPEQLARPILGAPALINPPRLKNPAVGKKIMGFGRFIKTKTLSGRLREKKRKALGLKSPKVKAQKQAQRKKVSVLKKRGPAKVRTRAGAGKMRAAAKRAANRQRRSKK